MVKDEGIKKLIDSLKDVKENSFAAGKGNEFEDQIQEILKSNGFTIKKFPKYKKGEKKSIDLNISLDVYKNIKKEVLDKVRIVPIKNKTGLTDVVIHQPFGSQNFPDFILFTDEWIIPLEIKFTTKTRNNIFKKPKWNSNLPKGNAIYIYAVAGGNTTYFLGSDFLGNNTRLTLVRYFKKIKDEGDKIINNCFYDLEKEQTNKNPFGLKPYIRTDYTYNKKFETYLKELEDSKQPLTIFEYSKIDKWEDNVLKFLESLRENEE